MPVTMSCTLHFTIPLSTWTSPVKVGNATTGTVR